ncbi:MAG TPA: type II secretion system F family protein [Pirellulales bacterium]|jgi:type IV pilus assembly protein PilC|nr:type II secretion system F family protein [Pirellulales bacterium]
MASFSFVARDVGGRVQRGKLEAASPSVLIANLRERGWLVFDVQADAPAGPDWLAQLATLNPGRYLPPRSADVELSLHQMAVMLRGGLTLLASIRTVAEQARRLAMRQVWEQVALRIQAGVSMADAMAEHKCFSNLVVQLVRVGEQTGNLEQVVVRGADILEKRRNLRGSLLTAMAYPVIVLLAAIGVTIFMLVSVIPKLQVFLSALGRKLPAMTQFLVDLADWMQVYMPYLLAGIVALIGAAVAVYSWPPGRYWVDRSALRVPVLGGLFRLASTATFSRSLGILIRSGVTLLEGLRTVERLHHNRYLAGQVVAARDSVMQGGTLADPLRTPHAFMPMLPAMVAVGESTGTLDEVLDEVARFHESQLQVAIRRFSVIIEPAIIVIVGGIVGFVYISFFMALFSTAGQAR